ncbi:Inner membrane protein ypdA [uncultured Clostridium sp.]|nr:Inner membrane protein ypdA [uncultured Clostridium sp.]
MYIFLEEIMKAPQTTRSIRSTLQNTYFLMLLSVFAIFMLYFVISESGKLRSSAFTSMELNVSKVSSYIDDEVSVLNTVAQNVSYSNLVKERYSRYLSDIDSMEPMPEPSEAYAQLKNTKILTDLLTSIIGPSQPVSQIYIYSPDQGTFGVGHDSSSSMESVKDQPWYQDFVTSGASRGVYCFPDQRLSKYYTGSNDMSFLSFCTMYYNNYNVPQGIIEIKNPLTSLAQKVDALGSLYGEKIFIYDSKGELIYPFAPDADPGYYTMLTWDTSKAISDNIYSDTLHGKNHLFYTRSNSTGYTSVISINNQQLWIPISDYIKVNMFIFLIIALATFLLSFLVSKVITNPITNIYNQVRSFPSILEGRQPVPSFPQIDTHIIELNTLYSALITMQKQTIDSMEREVTLHNQEMQSRMLALQSQMNPHFLYNSLSTIQSMADEGMEEEIITMCQTISRILRYISSDKELLVPLRDDLRHMTDYLTCMTIRYDEDLSYEVDIPGEMMDIRIPKLCLQLIVENSIKFTTKSVRAPWLIRVMGSLTATHWEISIHDNGPGFSDADIKNLEQKIASINETGLLPSLELNGMGLMNIYIRFKLLYQGNHIFKVSNCITGGAIVTIGGNL